MKTSILKQSKLFVLIFIFFLSTIAVNAQVAINSSSTPPAAGAMLDVSSTNTGVLIPRVNYNLISGLTVQGLLVYVTSNGPYGNGFYYYEGSSWKGLGDASGLLAVTAGGTGTGTAFTPSSVVFAGASGVYSQDNANFFWNPTSKRLGLGTATPATNLHINENNTDISPALAVAQFGTGDAAMRYYLNDNGIQHLTTGIDNNDSKNFKISNTTFLTGTTYTDANTMFRIHTESDASGSNSSIGITDINHQSRARVYLGAPQVIPQAVWMGVEFDMLTYDEHGEFIMGVPGIPGQFVAKEDGYYQVNARAEFAPFEQILYGGYVSIAIFKNGMPYAVGNNLQMTLQSEELMEKNNAPNVSDVLDLVAGDKIEIFVFQTFGAPSAILKVTDMTLPSPETPAITYVSIHKIS